MEVPFKIDVYKFSKMANKFYQEIVLLPLATFINCMRFTEKQLQKD